MIQKNYSKEIVLNFLVLMFSVNNSVSSIINVQALRKTNNWICRTSFIVQEYMFIKKCISLWNLTVLKHKLNLKMCAILNSECANSIY